MSALPPNPDLTHLRKQAKRLLREARASTPSALARFALHLPAARGLSPAALAAHPLKLHDAQSVIARDYGFRSWTELKRYVAWQRADRSERLTRWLGLVFDDRARDRALALRMLREDPALVASDAWLACVVGDPARIAAALAADPAFANAPGRHHGMPPLAAVSRSPLVHEPEFEPGLLAAARLLLAHGADPNGRWTDPRFPDNPLPVLYGAAGVTHHPAMTALLLEAGADPNDGESLYHAMESRDPACARLLLAAGARVGGSNALGRALDYERPETLALLLRQGDIAGERRWLHHALLRGRSLAVIRALLDAGADPRATDQGGVDVARFAAMLGRDDVTTLLRERGMVAEPSAEEAFVAASARGEEAAARRQLARDHGLLSRLDQARLAIMPQLAAIGRHEGVRTMLALGWPCEVRTAWDATALNLAIFVGDAAMVRLLLAAGADWRTRHGFGDIALGTLAFASQADDVGEPAPRDYTGCFDALADHGVPEAEFRRYRFSEEVTDRLDGRFGLAEDEG